MGGSGSTEQATQKDTGNSLGDSAPSKTCEILTREVDFALCLEIVAGTKTRDCVIGAGNWAHAQIGQRIHYTHGESNIVKTVITDVRKFPSAASALADNKVSEFIPSAVDVEDALKSYQFPASDEAKFGVVSFQFSIIREDGITNERHFS